MKIHRTPKIWIPTMFLTYRPYTEKCHIVSPYAIIQPVLSYCMTDNTRLGVYLEKTFKPTILGKYWKLPVGSSIYYSERKIVSSYFPNSIYERYDPNNLLGDDAIVFVEFPPAIFTFAGFLTAPNELLRLDP